MAHRVTFGDGRTVTFGKKKRPRQLSKLPYVFKKGARIDLPPKIAHGELFQVRKMIYVAIRRSGVDRLGRPYNLAYGQPVRVN